MIITISGKPGSGKGTVGKMLAKQLRYRFVTIGGIRREVARKKGMTLEQYNRLGEKSAVTDKPVDDWQRQAGRIKDRMVIEGRLSWYFIPHSFKIFLDVDLHEAARRILLDRAHIRRFEADFSTKASVLRALQRRIASDTKRYQRYYRVNIFRKKQYDLWLDSTDRSPVEIVGEIVTHLPKRNTNRRSAPRKKKKTVHHRTT